MQIRNAFKEFFCLRFNPRKKRPRRACNFRELKNHDDDRE